MSGLTQRPDGSYVLQDIRFVSPQPPSDRKPGQAPKPLSSDEKLRNGIFTTLTRKAWRALGQQVATALDAEAGPLPPDAAAKLHAKADDSVSAEESHALSDLVRAREKLYLARGLRVIEALAERHRRWESESKEEAE